MLIQMPISITQAGVLDPVDFFKFPHMKIIFNRSS